jgi:hypothetical protein
MSNDNNSFWSFSKKDPETTQKLDHFQNKIKISDSKLNYELGMDPQLYQQYKKNYQEYQRLRHISSILKSIDYKDESIWKNDLFGQSRRITCYDNYGFKHPKSFENAKNLEKFIERNEKIVQTDYPEIKDLVDIFTEQVQNAKKLLEIRESHYKFLKKLYDTDTESREIRIDNKSRELFKKCCDYVIEDLKKNFAQKDHLQQKSHEYNKSFDEFCDYIRYRIIRDHNDSIQDKQYFQDKNFGGLYLFFDRLSFFFKNVHYEHPIKDPNEQKQ